MRTRRWLGLSAALAVGVLASGCLTARFELDAWSEVQTPHFSVISNASQQQAVDLADMLEFFRAVAVSLIEQGAVEDRVPTRFYLFRSEQTYLPFQLDHGVVGYFMQPLDGNVLVANLNAFGLRAADVIFHEYTHLLLRNQDLTAPLWFDEGFAELLSTLSFTAAEEVVFGQAPVRRLEDLRLAVRSGRWIPIRELLATRNLNELPFQARPIFYAQAWVLVHFLYLGHLRNPEIPDYAEQVQRYLAAVNDGENADAAWIRVFGQSPDEFDALVQDYFSTGEVPSLRYSYQQFAWGGKVDVQHISRGETLTRLGELMLAINRKGDAARFMRRALAVNGDSARALAGLARTEPKAEVQDALFERALAADPNDGVVYGWRADSLADELEGEFGAEGPARDPSWLARAQEFAQRSIELRPDLPIGYVLQGRLLRLSERDPARAIPPFERAHALLPSHPRTTLWLGELYAEAGRTEQALRLLRRVEQFAHAGELSEEATRRIRELEQPRVAAPPDRTGSSDCQGECEY